MIIVYGGNQVDEQGRAPSRFPESNVAHVGERLRQLLRLWRPRLLIGAAASGADLLILEAARGEGLDVRVVLPFAIERFVETSVSPRGPAWIARFRRLVDPAAMEILDETEDNTVYLRTNAAFFDRAAAVANPEEEIVALVVRPPHESDESVSDDLAARAAARGHLVVDLDPSVQRADMPTAFVAMAYGTKSDPVTQRPFDCDQVFAQVIVPALEDADLAWFRSDREVENGVIHIGMIEALANSAIVVVDTATLNANVFYELGLRHAFADKVTLLIGPMSQAPPFDVAMIRRIGYPYSGSRLTERDARSGIESLSPFLVRAARNEFGADSPLFEWFPLARSLLERRTEIDKSQTVELEFRERVAAALRGADTSAMVEVSDKLGQADLPGSTIGSLRVQIGMGLLDSQAFADSLRVLESVELAQHHPLRRLLLEQHAFALRRIGESQADGVDVDAVWSRAEALLDESMAVYGASAETCGIAAGLAKRRFVRFVRAGESRARPQLDRAIEQYRRGFMSDPLDHYTGVNLVSLLRLRGQHFNGAESDLDEARELAVVVRFVGRRVDDGVDFWIAASLAELELTQVLLGGADTVGTLAAYSSALARQHKPNQERSLVDQLEIFLAAGDPPNVIAPLLALTTDLRALDDE